MASLLARHKKGCALGARRQTAIRAGGCTCKPTYYLVESNVAGGRRPVGDNLKDAERHLAHLVTDVDRGEYRRLEDVKFAAWADQWLANRKVTESTRRDYKTTLDYAKAAFGTRIVRKLTVKDVDRFVELIAAPKPREKGRPRKGGGESTQAKHLRVLHGCLESARRRDYIGANPVERLGDDRPRARRREASYFQNDELPALWVSALPHDRPVFQLAYLTGMRMGELCGLRWGNVNLTDAVIHVREQYSEKLGAFTRPKTAAGERDVHLSPEAVRLLAKWDVESGRRGGEGTALVFVKRRSNDPRRGTSILANLYSAMERAGIPRQGPPPTGDRDFHSLRHTYAKAVLEREPPVSLKWLQRQLGHASLSVTVDTYGHFESAKRRAVAESLEGSFVV